MSIHRVLVPPIKCQGIKTKLVPWIKAIIPADFDGRWNEPFMRSGVVVFNVRPRNALLADSNRTSLIFTKQSPRAKSLPRSQGVSWREKAKNYCGRRVILLLSPREIQPARETFRFPFSKSCGF